MPIETTLDHTGPMTSNVANNALLLEAWPARTGSTRARRHRIDAYTKALDNGVKGVKIAVVKEGFGLPQSEADVDEEVKKAPPKRFESSVPTSRKYSTGADASAMGDATGARSC